MEWLTTQFSGENAQVYQLIFITLALTILLIVVVWTFRKLSGSAARRSMRSRVPRLSITDSTTVDDKRYLVMVRRDNVEHLLLIGGANDMVVESNIIRASTPQKPIPAGKPVEIRPQPEQKVQEMEAGKEPDENPGSLAKPLAATAATGLAAASTAKSQVTEKASEAVETVANAASSTVETSTEIVGDMSASAFESISSVNENISTHVSDGIDTAADKVASVRENVTDEPIIEVSDNFEAELSKVTEEIEAPKIDEADLESTISAKLDDALSSDDIDLGGDDTTEAVSAENIDTDTGSSDDEMKRLLDELSGETKENA